MYRIKASHCGQIQLHYRGVLSSSEFHSDSSTLRGFERIHSAFQWKPIYGAAKRNRIQSVFYRQLVWLLVLFIYFSPSFQSFVTTSRQTALIRLRTALTVSRLITAFRTIALLIPLCCHHGTQQQITYTLRYCACILVFRAHRPTCATVKKATFLITLFSSRCFFFLP